jgi:hypothetical protein
VIRSLIPMKQTPMQYTNPIIPCLDVLIIWSSHNFGCLDCDCTCRWKYCRQFKSA